MISYEDARQIREKANAPLTWDETVPAPPIDRIELTRRILETAEAAGLDFPAWDAHLPHIATEKTIEQFQDQLRRFIPNQSETSIFEYVGMYSDGATGDGYDPLTGGEYIERLENDYFRPWQTSWRFGASAECKSNVLSLFQTTVVDAQFVYERENFPLPSEATIKGHEIIAKHTPAEVGLGLAKRLQSEVGLKIALVENRWLGLPERWAILLPLALGLLGCIISIIGAVQRRYSGWLLIVIIPVSLLASVVFIVQSAIPLKSRWRDKTMTFDKLAEKVVALKKREWAELQQTYTAQ